MRPRHLAALAALSFAPTFAGAATVSGSAALTTDYVFRGISQSLGDPAVQAGVRVQSGSGWYGALWGSSVEFAGDTGASTELDYSAGWSGALTERTALDIGITHFDYPSARSELDYAELIATLTWSSNYWLTLGYSNDVFATDSSGIYTQLGGKIPLADRWRLEAAAGYYHLDDAYDDSYAHVQLGLVWAIAAPVELRLTAHATDSAAKTQFPGIAGSRVEAAVAAAF